MDGWCCRKAPDPMDLPVEGPLVIIIIIIHASLQLTKSRSRHLSISPSLSHTPHSGRGALSDNDVRLSVCLSPVRHIYMVCIETDKPINVKI